MNNHFLSTQRKEKFLVIIMCANFPFDENIIFLKVIHFEKKLIQISQNKFKEYKRDAYY